MKQTIFTLLLFCTIGLFSCRKDKIQPTITQYDNSQILNYISANNITGMVKDTSGGDTTGMYYKIINPGTTDTLLNYTDNIAFVFTLRSFDGKYASTDTIENHYQGYIGHVTADALPAGLQIALVNDLRHRGASMRLLIPSRMAYGVDGYGSGSTQNAGTHIAANQCLDYYVHVIDNQATYDDQVIQNYIKSNTLTGYNKTASGLYYKIDVQGTGTDSITQNSTVTANFAGRLLNNVFFTTANNPIVDTVSLETPSLIKGVQEGLSHVTTGATISMIIPSALAYGSGSFTGDVGTVPPNSPLRFEFEVRSVSP